jgi:hypothetical protein
MATQVIVKTESTWPTVVGAIAAGVAAIAAAVGTFFAWRSASSSATAARNASRALAVVMFPRLRHHVYQQIGDPEDETARLNRWHLDVWNESAWDAVDVHAEVRLRDGRRFGGNVERLKPAQQSPPAPSDDTLVVEIPDMPSDNKAGYASVVSTSVTWSDTHRIARWEATRDWTGGYAPPSADAVRQIEGPSIVVA